MAYKKTKHYVMFGFNIGNPDMTGYLGADMKSIVDDIQSARLFSRRIRKSGSPEDWLKMINEDDDLNMGYKFHLVATCI